MISKRNNIQCMSSIVLKKKNYMQSYFAVVVGLQGICTTLFVLFFFCTFQIFSDKCALIRKIRKIQSGCCKQMGVRSYLAVPVGRQAAQSCKQYQRSNFKMEPELPAAMPEELPCTTYATNLWNVKTGHSNLWTRPKAPCAPKSCLQE